MDNCLFPRRGAHLHAAQPCAPIPLSDVARKGTKHGHGLFLWITRRLCQNYPQFYALNIFTERIGIEMA